MAEAGLRRRLGHDLFRPQIAVEIDLDEIDFAGIEIKAEFDPSIIEGHEFARDLLRHRFDPGREFGVVEPLERSLFLVLDQIAFFVIGPQALRVFALIPQHRERDGLVTQRDEGALDVVAGEVGFDDGIVAIAVDVEDRIGDFLPVRGIGDAPAGRGGIGLDHPAARILRGQVGLAHRSAATIAEPRCGGHAGMFADQLRDRLVVAQSAQEGHRAEIGQTVLVAQDRDQHLAVHEAAAIEQRKDEIDLGLAVEHVILVREHEVEPEPFERRAHFVMVDRVVAVLGMHAAAEQRVLGHEQHADALPGFIWDAKRGKRERHSCRGSNVRSASALSALSEASQQYGRLPKPLVATKAPHGSRGPGCQVGEVLRTNPYSAATKIRL